MVRTAFPIARLAFALALWVGIHSTLAAQPMRRLQAVYGNDGDDFGDGGLLMLDDGGLMFVGRTTGFGPTSDLYIAKTDACGHPLWARTYDLGGNEYGSKIRFARPDGYAIIGTTEDAAGDRDAFLLTIENNGDVRWCRTYGDRGAETTRRQEGLNMRVDDPNGDIYAVGFVGDGVGGGEDAWIWKTDRNGALVWAHTYGGTADDRFNGIDWTIDRNMVAVGSTRSFSWNGNSQVLAMRFKPEDGTVRWTVQRGGPYDDEARSGAVSNFTTDFFVVGVSGHHQYAERIDDSDGRTLNEVILRPRNSELSAELNEVVMTQYRPYAVGGVMREDGTWDMHAVRFSSAMDPQQSRTYGGPGNETGFATIRVFDHAGTVDSAAFLGTTRSFGRGGSDIYLVGTTNDLVSGCSEEQYAIVSVAADFTGGAVQIGRFDGPGVGTPTDVVTIERFEHTVLCNQCATQGVPGQWDEGSTEGRPDLTDIRERP